MPRLAFIKSLRAPLPVDFHVPLHCGHGYAKRLDDFLLSSGDYSNSDISFSLLSRNFIVKGSAEGRVWQLSFSGEGSAIGRICFRRTGPLYPRIPHRI